MTISVFSNFWVNSEENFSRMKDSFYSFKDAAIDKWIINCRGAFKDEVAIFLKRELNDNVLIFNLDSSAGWFHDSRKLIKHIKSDLVFYWIEDHICIGGINYLNSIFEEIKTHQIDYVGYSWFGLGTYKQEFSDLKLHKAECLSFLNYRRKENDIRQKNSLRITNQYSVIISLCGIFSKSYFKKIVFSKRPYLRRWPKEVPFDFEKRHNDTFILPVKMGILHNELFASIDDDNAIKGSSLISRNLYSDRISREEMLHQRKDFETKKKYTFLKFVIHRMPLGTRLLHFAKRLSYHL